MRKAGSSQHMEYWVPAEELDQLNAHIRGEIRVIAKFVPASLR
jgi:hypothetical protein